MGGQYMLGIASDETPSDPVLVLKSNGPNTATLDYTNQPLIIGYGADQQRSFALQASGKMGLGTATPVVSGTGKLHNSGDTIRAIDQLRTPASATESCNRGEITFDTSFIYVCVADNTWKKAPLSSF